jgi:hypothetical protein
MHIGFLVFAPLRKCAGCSAIRMRALSLLFGAQKNDLRGMRTKTFRVVRSQGSPRSRSSGWRLAHIPGVRSTARRVPPVRQGEARASGVLGGQPALYQAVCFLRRPPLPQLSNPGCCPGVEAGLAYREGAGQAVNATARFRSAYPDVEVLLKEVHSDEGLEAVRTGRLDLCLLHPPRTANPALNIETIWLEPLVALLPPKHPLADKQRISLQRLRSEPWVISPREIASRYYDEVIAACSAAGFEPRIAQRTTQLTTTISMVASGIGVALLPITSARLAFRGAVYRQLRPPRSSIPVAFAWRQDQT